MLRLIQPGETGVDFSYSKPPPARLVELGFSFVVGYISPNTSKNLLNPLDYINAGLGVAYVWERGAATPNLGRPQGLIDGAEAKRQLIALGVPAELPVIAAFDTNTVATNIANHKAYDGGFFEAVAPYSSLGTGGYDDTDLAAVTDHSLDWLPLAWSWSGSSKAEAQAKARALGFDVFQEKGYWIDNKWAVDPNTCIAPFYTWGTPRDADTLITDEEDMKPVLLTINEAPGGIYLWVPGKAPVPFTSVPDLVAIAAGLGLDPNVTHGISQAMFDRLVDNAKVALPPIVVPAPVVKFPAYTVTPV